MQKHDKLWEFVCFPPRADLHVYPLFETESVVCLVSQKRRVYHTEFRIKKIFSSCLGTNFWNQAAVFGFCFDIHSGGLIKHWLKGRKLGKIKCTNDLCYSLKFYRPPAPTFLFPVILSVIEPKRLFDPRTYISTLLLKLFPFFHSHPPPPFFPPPPPPPFFLFLALFFFFFFF